MAQFLLSTPREDKAAFLLGPCILILKVAKNFRETFFRGIELIRVEVMQSRETWRHNDIKKEIQNEVGMVDYKDRIMMAENRWNECLLTRIEIGEHATNAFQFTGVGRLQGDRRMGNVTKKKTKWGIYVAYCSS